MFFGPPYFDAPFWALLGLIIFLAILVYMKVPRTISGSLDGRAAAIREELETARKLRIEAEALLAEYKRKAATADSEARAIVDQATREAEALGREARQRMEEYVASRTRMAETKIAQAEAQALQEVRALSADVAIAAAERILAVKTKGAPGDALIEKSIADVKARLH
jgi:F-type H+-transporting ATPase subunit b